MIMGVVMNKIAFIAQRKVVGFEVEGKKVKYFDEMWKEGIQIYPLDEKLIKKLKRTGDKTLQVMAALILDSNKGENLKEYQSCNSEEEIIEFIRKDCRNRGLLEVK